MRWTKKLMAPEQTMDQDFAEDVAKMREHMGLDPECTPCAVPGGIEALQKMSKDGNEALDLAPLMEELPNNTPMEEWLERMRTVVSTCDADRGNCYVPTVVLAAVEEVIEEGGGLPSGEVEVTVGPPEPELLGAVDGEDFDL